MSISDEIRAELNAANQDENKAQAQNKAEAAQNMPERFADPTDDHIDYFNYTESRGFLTTFLESILVNFGPSSNSEAALQRDMYFSVAGFTHGDSHRMEFASIADTNAPPPVGRTENLSEKIAPVTNFSRGSGRAVEGVYESYDEIYGERLASAARDLHNGFSRAATNAQAEQPQLAENNYAPDLSTPAA